MQLAADSRSYLKFSTVYPLIKPFTVSLYDGSLEEPRCIQSTSLTAYRKGPTYVEVYEEYTTEYISHQLI